MKLNSRLFLFFLLFCCLGYFREFFFVQINNILYQKFYNTTTALPVGFIMKPFQNWSYSNLYYSKYIFTILWVVLFYLANLFAVKKLSESNSPVKFLNYIYISLAIGAISSMGYGLIVNHRLQDDEYTLSRWLMGIAQSPIICLILLASEKLYNTQSNDSSKEG